MIELEFVREFVFENFPRVRVTKRGTHFNGRCILCGDSKKSQSKRRFNLDWNNGKPVWQCFNCGRSGSFVPLYAEVRGITFEKAKQIIFNFDPDTFSDRTERAKDRWNGGGIKNFNSEPLTEYHDYILKSCISSFDDKPTGYIKSNLQKALRQFISKRSIPNHIRMYVAYEGRYRNRFIIPVYEGNMIVYFQARAIHKHMQPKYINPIAEKERIILNKEKFDPDKYIIVTEGLIDAFMIPNQGTASLGSSISENFLKELGIENESNKGIVLFFDNDDPGKKAFNKFTDREYGNKYKDKVKYFLFPDKYKRDYEDLNELVTGETIENVYDFIISNSYNLVTARTFCSEVVKRRM